MENKKRKIKQNINNNCADDNESMCLDEDVSAACLYFVQIDLQCNNFDKSG